MHESEINHDIFMHEYNHMPNDIIKEVRAVGTVPISSFAHTNWQWCSFI